MSDIVQELRGKITTPYDRIDRLRLMAAEEIVCLQARICELEGDLDSAEEYICELKAEQEGEA